VKKLAISSYSKVRDGATQLSANFKVSEFACKDGSDAILIDDKLVVFLQKIRDHFAKPVTINSSYRTANHNAKNGGSPNSQHLYGKAADISVAGVVPLQVAQYAESIGVGGIGHAPAGQGNYVHVDTRTVISRWDYINGGKNTKTVSSFGSAPSTPGTPDKPTSPPATNTTITIEGKSFFVNGQEIKSRAGLVDNENYVHLRDFIAALEGGIVYDEKTRRVSIKV